MEWIFSILLGVFQGLTEFLPISSSGHLVILQNLFGFKEGNLFLNLVLHTGTLVSVVVFFFPEILSLLFSLRYWKKPLLYWIILANIPTAAIGLVIKKFYGFLSQIWVIGFLLILNGFILFLVKKRQETASGTLNASKILIIGAVQGMAALPGISRSGSTISASLFINIRKETAFAFSFLISIPAVLGADFLELKDFLSQETFHLNLGFGPLATGFLAATATGFLALFLLKKMILASRFHYFGYYCLLAGAAALIGGLW